MNLAMIPDLIYIFIAIFLLQFYNWQQSGEGTGRTIEFNLITGVYAIYAVLTGKIFLFDTVTTALCIVLGIMFLSLLWSDSRRSPFEAVTWACYFILFMACRLVPAAYTLIITLACASVFASFQIYFQIRPKPAVYDDKPKNHWSFMYIFGNNNHTGAYLLLHVPVGFYLTVTGHPWAAILTVIISTALVLARCYAALLGLFAALSGMLVYTYGWWMIIIIGAGVFCALPIPVITNDRMKKLASDGKILTLKHRVLLWYQAWLLIKQKPVFGWGMDMYRKMVAFIAPEARKNETIKGYIADIGGMNQNKSHRCHNDHLEILIELGVVGYLAFVWLFLSIPLSLLSIGIMLAIAVNGLFFFPLRETHIAAPFWAIMGACAFSASSPVIVPWAIKIGLVAALLAVLSLCQRKFLGLYYYDRAIQSPELQDKITNVSRALQFDPYNNRYLNEMTFRCPVGTMANYDAAARSMWHYDGDGIMWQTWEQFAKAIVGINHLGAARCALSRALEINPEYTSAARLKAQIEAYLAEQMQPPPEPAPFKPVKIRRPEFIKRRKR